MIQKKVWPCPFLVFRVEMLRRPHATARVNWDERFFSEYPESKKNTMRFLFFAIQKQTLRVFRPTNPPTHFPKSLARRRLLPLFMGTVKFNLLKLIDDGQFDIFKRALVCARYRKNVTDVFLITYLASRGRTEWIKFLRAKGFKWNAAATLYAATNGHFSCLFYLHAHGCPWDRSRMTRAAMIGGDIDCVDYVRRYGCPWGKYDILEACSRGHFHCADYAIANGCPYRRGDYYMYKIEWWRRVIMRLFVFIWVVFTLWLVVLACITRAK